MRKANKSEQTDNIKDYVIENGKREWEMDDTNSHINELNKLDLLFQYSLEKERKTSSIRQMKFRKKLILGALIFSMFIFVGGAVISHFKMSVTDHGRYSDIEINLNKKVVSQNGFYAIPTRLIENYKMSEPIKSETDKIIFFTDENGISVYFTESLMNLSHALDTEQTYITSVILENGIQGAYIEKNGATLIWEQEGYFYMLYSPYADINLSVIASSLEKIK